MKNNILTLIRLFMLILPIVGLIALIVVGLINVVTEEPTDTSWFIVNQPIGPTELRAQNPVALDNIYIEESSLEPEESNELKEETEPEDTFTEEIEESIVEESDESEEPKHTMGVESSKPDYSGVVLEGPAPAGFTYHPKYFDERYNAVCNIPLNYEHQVFAYKCCEKYGVPYELMLGLWGAESTWNINIGVTNGTYYGIGQIHINYCEEYLRKYGVELCTPLGGLEGSIIIVRDKLNSCGGDVNKALMSYNCGDYGASRLWEQGIYSTYYTRKILSIANNLQ